MSYLFKKIIIFYQKYLKPALINLGLRGQKTCRFHPTCSEYSLEAFNKYNFFKATFLSIKRVLSCGPWSKGGIDLP
jgi:putative membrane protein insertion efficiency factor